MGRREITELFRTSGGRWTTHRRSNGASGPRSSFANALVKISPKGPRPVCLYETPERVSRYGDEDRAAYQRARGEATRYAPDRRERGFTGWDLVAFRWVGILPNRKMWSASLTGSVDHLATNHHGFAKERISRRGETRTRCTARRQVGGLITLPSLDNSRRDHRADSGSKGVLIQTRGWYLKRRREICDRHASCDLSTRVIPDSGGRVRHRFQEFGWTTRILTIRKG